jgi:hypothetical protein
MGVAANNPYISPAFLSVSAHFRGFPRTFLIADGAETLRHYSHIEKKRMVADMGEGYGEGQATMKLWTLFMTISY